MKIRIAEKKDAAAIVSIYAYYVIHTEITFEYEVPTIKEYEERMQAIQDCYPFLVMEKDGHIIGYAYAHRMFERKAYDWDVELSQYFEAAHTGKGYGSVLFAALMELLKLQQVRNAYSLITLPNALSEGLQRKYGFEKCGVFHKTGYKNGTWLDVGVYEKQLLPYDQKPMALIPFSKLQQEQIKRILSER